ncbi:MAG: prepilin peptidase [Fimbriimonadales bacterium]|nr:prepilin peptidase [Fimbriimonadales bacterium]
MGAEQGSVVGFPGWTWLFGFLIGSCIGSFLNVVVYRVPRGLSLSEPKSSFCPSCRHPLGVPDLVPILSWLALRGRCRHCGARIHPRYMLVELLTGALFALLWHQHLVQAFDPAKAVAYALASATLVAIVFIDFELYIIPDSVNAFLALVGVAWNVWLYASGRPEATTWGIPSALAGWIVGTVAIWLILLFGRALFGKDAMGHGDIKMARGIGAVLFPASALMSFGLAVVAGAVLGALQVLLRGRGREDDEASPEDAAGYEPESYASIFRSGLGYLLGIDILGLFLPGLYRRWFGEEPEAGFDEEEFQVEPTMIPFGPYLALGAIAATVFQGPLWSLVERYQVWAGLK